MVVTDAALEADILRLHHVEAWGPHTIARQLDIHHSVVNRVLSRAGLPRAVRAPRPTMIDAYLPFINQTLERYPTLSAERLYRMAVERGYPGGPSQFRARIAEIRPRPVPEAYLRLVTQPGEQAQVDWGHFGTVSIGQAKRPLMAFVMVLSHSRRIFLRFYLNAATDNFVRGHVEAFTAWGGVARCHLYDNLKSAVIERRADAIRFHPTLLALAAHYRFEPRPVAVRRGNEKGRVERAIRYIRDSFFAGLAWRDVDQLNTLADQWCAGTACDRRCPGQPGLTVREAFEAEVAQLVALPPTVFETDEVVDVRVGKQPYARFDLNDYSVPHRHVRRTVNVRASLETVRLFVDGEPIAEHRRLWGKGETGEDTAHIDALVAHKRAAREHRGQDRLRRSAPASAALLEQAAARGTPLRSLVRELLELLDLYGANELEVAVREALEREVPHTHAVRQALERRREARAARPPIALRLSDPKVRDVTVRAAALGDYDHLGGDDHNDHDHDHDHDHDDDDDDGDGEQTPT